MSYYGKHVVVNSAVDLNKKLKDFLVSCGWVLEGPTDTEPHRIAQEDKHAFILGWFLRSNGEDGKKDIPIHIGWQTLSTTTRTFKGATGYLSAEIDAVVTTIPLFTAITGVVSGDVVQIGDECISVGSIAGSNLVNCVRGIFNTTPAAHDSGDVVARGTSSIPGITVYGGRDLTNPVLSSSGTPTWNFTQNTSTNITLNTTNFLAARSASKVNLGGLVRFPDGRMRWILTQTAPSDNVMAITYDDLLTAPGAVSATFLSAGWFPHSSRKMIVGPSSGLRSPCVYCTISSPRDVWFYGSKDGVAIVFMSGNGAYRVFYWGTYVPFANSNYTIARSTIDGTIAKGATQIKVTDVSLFTAGARYVIFSQKYQDWFNNRNCYASTYMGAAGTGQWADLDIDETAFEHIVVTAVNPETKILTLQNGLCYSYTADLTTGPVIGEDPRPHCGYAFNNQTSSQYTQFGDTAVNATSTCFHASAQPRIGTHPCHRTPWRCTTSVFFKPDGTVDPWNADFGQNLFAVMHQSGGSLGIGVDYDNRFSRGHLSPFIVKGGGTDTSWYKYGGDVNCYFGLITQVRDTGNAWGGVSEDTVKAMWNGQFETFRLFYFDWSNGWIAMGPEISPPV
jgi:hypothetical protein